MGDWLLLYDIVQDSTGMVFEQCRDQRKKEGRGLSVKTRNGVGGELVVGKKCWSAELLRVGKIPQSSSI